MPLFLLGALGWLKRAFSAALALITRYPLQAALLVALLACGWLWHGKGKAIEQRDVQIAGRAADRKAVAAAQVEAARLALAAKAATEARYRTIAKEADHAYQAELADARSDAERYIAANRVRPETAGRSPRQAAGPAEDRAAVVPVGLPATSVMVSANDVRACTDATTYALSARAWALGLTK